MVSGQLSYPEALKLSSHAMMGPQKVQRCGCTVHSAGAHTAVRMYGLRVCARHERTVRALSAHCTRTARTLRAHHGYVGPAVQGRYSLMEA